MQITDFCADGKRLEIMEQYGPLARPPGRNGGPPGGYP
jgi:hypothetical protein